VAGGRHTRTETVAILKQLAGSIAFPTSRSNTNSRIAWATNFCGLMGLGRHSAPQGGVSVFEAAWASSHAGLFGGAQEQLVSGMVADVLTALYSSSVTHYRLALTPIQTDVR
jgi:hypothetical protein